MKLLILAAIICACAAAPQFLPNPYRAAPNYYPDNRVRASVDRNAQILRSTSEVNENGFHYAFDTDNGISAEETGVESNGIQAQGQYSYTGDDGQVYSVRYTADANGFQAQGAHIPTPPPIPEAIARALQQNAADEARGIFDDGSYNDGKYNAGSVFAARANFNRYQPNQYQPNQYQQNQNLQNQYQQNQYQQNQYQQNQYQRTQYQPNQYQSTVTPRYF